jgi:hypothetical protein
MAVQRQVELRFGGDGALTGAPLGLSAVCRDGPWLWLAGDGESRLERLRMESRDGASYDDRRSLPAGGLRRPAGGA